MKKAEAYKREEIINEMSFTKIFLIRVLYSGSASSAHKLLYDLQNK